MSIGGDGLLLLRSEIFLGFRVFWRNEANFFDDGFRGVVGSCPCKKFANFPGRLPYGVEVNFATERVTLSVFIDKFLVYNQVS